MKSLQNEVAQTASTRKIPTIYIGAPMIKADSRRERKFNRSFISPAQMVEEARKVLAQAGLLLKSPVETLISTEDERLDAAKAAQEQKEQIAQTWANFRSLKAPSEKSIRKDIALALRQKAIENKDEEWL